ncbi:hypothetical protein AB0N05_37645 [Nocardia sp. NPDC051030]|uniref:hypothetical protein n=1 Tax=Nocardia sp. NPDC051030 TaxID=3155162 RepID=UPI00341C4676
MTSQNFEFLQAGDTRELGEIGPTPPEVYAQAQRVVCSQATDSDDAHQLLKMLGLMPSRPRRRTHAAATDQDPPALGSTP